MDDPAAVREISSIRQPPSPRLATRWVASIVSLTCAGLVLVTLFFAEPAAAESEVVEPTAGEQLRALIDAEWQFRTMEFPELATATGVHDHDSRLTDMSFEALERRADAWRAILDQLRALDSAHLTPEERVDAAIFEGQIRDFVADFDLGHYHFPITVDDGFHIGFARLPREMPFARVADYENYLARLRAFPTYAEQNIALMAEGLEQGRTLPRVVLEGYEVTIESHVVGDPTTSLFWGPFESMPATFSEAEVERLRSAGRKAILGSVVAGYRAFLEFMTERYIPGARTTLGATDMEGGDAYYAHRVRHFTTLDLDAETIHQTGLREVARIRAEMEAIIEGLGFEGSFADFLEHLRTDPKFYAKTPEELLKEASYLAKRADAALPALFGRLPRQPYGVAPVPDHLAPKYTGGRYVGSAPGSTEPGYYWVNTYKLESRPLYTLPALSLHEAVPGHHLQIALNQELDDLLPFRRFSYISAFGEGWGLYSEWLGIEMGIYDDPYDNFGRLTYEMWRACRLVVDTGLHAKGWTRQQAMDYLASNTALSIHEVTTETDRYISWPAQALAYKLGELEIRALRSEAEATLGERFDIRDFHDLVLSNGSVPLSVLRQVVEEWIDAGSAG